MKSAREAHVYIQGNENLENLHKTSEGQLKELIWAGEATCVKRQLILLCFSTIARKRFQLNHHDSDTFIT